MYFFTADEHFGHTKIIEYSNRPFSSITTMDAEIIKRHNEVVSEKDIVIHVGDFALVKKEKVYKEYISQLKGSHVFLRGSHDRWLNKKSLMIWEKNINGIYVVACHYAMRVWPRSHYNSWLVYGHSHGKLESFGKSYDVGVDNNNFYPVSFDELVEIMKSKLDNFNLVKKLKGDKVMNNKWRATDKGETKIPCKYCGELTSMTGTKMCDNCWEMESRMSRNIEVAEKILEKLKQVNIEEKKYE